MNKLQWISIDGSVVDEAQGMANNSHISDEDIALVLQGNSLADMSRLVFRDPDHFLAGELHRHAPQWNALLNDMNDERFSEVRDWITNGVDVTKFFRPFKGSYKGRNYECGSPPPCVFPNHLSCKPFASFISDTLLDRLRSGAISLWGKVGECTPPHLIMPLTVEPSKPRLCNDDRFLNLWIEDRPFALDSVQHLPKYVNKGFYQTVCDDKSGYDHIKLHPSSRTYFGFQWGGWYFVSECIPFGWKSSAYIYHTAGLVASHRLRSWNIPSSLYIDDRHNGQLSFPGGILPAAYQALASRDEVNFALAVAGIFLTCYILISLGYFIGLAKSHLTPKKQVPYLGFGIDSELQAFTLLPHKKEKLLRLIKETLARDNLDLLTLQRLSGKCVSMSLAVPGARLYVNEINLAVSRATRSARPVKMSAALKNEIEHWLFLETWDGFLPWRSEKHTHVRLFSDSSRFAWGGALSPGAIEANVYDYWDASTIQADIATKETLALNNVLESFADTIKNSWVDAFVDSMALVRSWNRQGSRSQSLSSALKKLFNTMTKLNIDLHLTFVPSSQNQADFPSRRLSLQDAKLCPSLWIVVQEWYGGENGHSVDLMARPSNAQSDLSGAKLPFFSENPLPGSLGVNVFAQSPDLYDPFVFKNPYAFPPICLIPHVIKYMRSLQLSYTIVVPDVCPRHFWWPLLTSTCSSRYLLAVAGSVGALLTPSKHGFSNNWPIPWDLWVFRIG